MKIKDRRQKIENRKESRLSILSLFLSSVFYFLVLACRVEADHPQPSFTLSLSDGVSASGPLERIDDHWSVRLGGTKPVQASAMQVISLRQDKATSPSLPKIEQIILANGDRFPG